MTIYLYIKTHNKTGLKYLGKTVKNPYLYSGSGKNWIKHLKQHGNNVSTEILRECSSIEELQYWGRYYSNYFMIVTAQDNFGNKIWANKIPETGGGPGRSGFHKGKNNPMHGKQRLDLKSDDSPNKLAHRRNDSRKLALKLWSDPEFKERKSSHAKKMWEDPAYKQKMALRKGTTKKVNINGIDYKSLKEAAIMLNLDPSTISKRCTSNDKKYSTWTYV